MAVNLKELWHKISRIGLREDEGVHNMRNIIFMNRLLSVMLTVGILFIFIEITLHGFQLVYMIIILLALVSIPLILHHYRKFRFSTHFTFYVLALFIFNGGLTVGETVNNNITLIPNMLVGVIIFKSRLEKIWALVFTIGLYLVQYNLFDHIPPRILIDSEIIYIFKAIFYIMALIFTFFAGYYLTMINKDYEDVILLQKDSLEEKNKEITDSIKYAKRIQNAILPPMQSIKEYLPQSFVLYKPKDIVAGDFYWMEAFGSSQHQVDSRQIEPTTNHQSPMTIFIAAADCTGHGVPGAMVSVVCNNGLNRSVREFGLTDPGKILDQTRELVIKEFEKSEEEVKDGMDIAIVSIESSRSSSGSREAGSNHSTLNYAGAHNPLWIIRKGAEEVEEIKANKQPIGVYADTTPFKTHSIELNSGDSIYIFSDGYVDQFGGEKGKKLKSKNFKKLLLSIVKEDPEIQKEKLDQFFENWRGTHEQIDDVCVIGVRL